MGSTDVVQLLLAAATILVAAAAALKQSKWLTRVLLFLAISVSLLVMASVVLQWVSRARAESELNVIAGAVMRANDLELEQYKEPGAFDSAELEQIFLPVSLGGSRLAVIKEGVHNLLKEGNRYGEESNQVTSVTSVRLIDEGTALVETIETWYLRLRTTSGEPVEQPASQKNVYSHQFYRLVKVGGKWLVKDNPAPTRW